SKYRDQSVDPKPWRTREPPESARWRCRRSKLVGQRRPERVSFVEVPAGGLGRTEDPTGKGQDRKSCPGMGAPVRYLRTIQSARLQSFAMTEPLPTCLG